MFPSVGRTSLLLATTFLFPLTAAVVAQEPVQPAAAKPAEKVTPTGSVTGHVMCTDTQRPAHYADIFLVPKTAAGQDVGPNTLSLIKGRTQVDGTFALKNVPVGDYFVMTRLAGYILPITRDESAGNDPTKADLNKILAKFPQIHVTANTNATVETTISPGASISGRVEFDDGTPVAGQFVEIQSDDEHDPWRQFMATGMMSDLSLWVHQDTTDDEGRYRFSGLPAGKYWLFTVIQPEMDQRKIGNAPLSGLIQQSFTVYPPSAFRKSQAKPIEVQVTDHHDNDNIIITLAHVFTLRGKVLGGKDQHPVNYGSVSLHDPNDEKDFARFTPLDSDGTFHFDDVPEGNYSISVMRAADIKPGGDPYRPVILHSYADSKTTATVAAADLTVNNILLEDANKSASPAPAASRLQQLRR